MRGAVIGKTLMYLFLVLAGLLFIYPLVYMLLGSLATLADYQLRRYIPIPRTINLAGYEDLFGGTGELATAVQVTLKRVVWFVTWGLLVSLLAGYAFSRLRFAGRDTVFMIFLAGLAVPGMLISLPLYMLMVRFPLVGGNNILGVGGQGLLNSWAALLVLGMVPIFSLFLMKQNMDMIPIEYEEAAIMDGAGLFTILFRIYVPMLKPAMAVIVVQTFIGVWNEYFMPLILVAGKTDLAPLAVALQRLIAREAIRGEGVFIPRFDLVFAGGTFMCLPPIILYVLMQRQFVQGLVGVGVRG